MSAWWGWAESRSLKKSLRRYCWLKSMCQRLDRLQEDLRQLSSPRLSLSLCKEEPVVPSDQRKSFKIGALDFAEFHETAFRVVVSDEGNKFSLVSVFLSK